MSTLLLVRHGLTTLTGPVLTGRAPNVHLDERGRGQADAVAARIGALDLAAIVTSPMERCVETAAVIRAAQRLDLSAQWVIEPRVVECDYGEWTGQPIPELVKQPLWKIVQGHPSAARFPNGEALTELSARAVAAVRDWDARLGADAVWVLCSHGDVIKAILADALGLHLDQFQRLAVDPCSVSVVRYTPARPYVLRTNDIAGSLIHFAPSPTEAAVGDDATVGGGAGAGQT